MADNSIFKLTLGKQPWLVIVLTLLALVFGMGLGAALGNLVVQSLGVDIGQIMNSEEAIALDLLERQGIRWFNLVAHVFSFTFAAVLVAWLAKGDRNWTAFLQLDRFTTAQLVGLSVLLLVATLPLIQFSNWLNANLPLPEWMISMEDSQNWLVGEVLRMESFKEFLVALTVAAVAPAIGEELLFRGLLQPQLQKLVNNPHWGIWLSAILFSAIHLQFVGFFPRMLLGALLGYLLWWSGSLWLPILIHFLFNGVQILGAYFNPEAMKVAVDATEIEMPPIWLVALSLLAVGYLVKRFHEKRIPEAINQQGDGAA
ncbi:CPBP family intramembrane glutamic endopeptidase [Lewinella cohaerens]|uniref:CPBP family intramembrane glutamic endopeptidase n=1 Tax=Lewinella cohaerens TaxID=70995 RepID=UPI00035DCBB9|nr:CPBP family intramembrane glutamic endopeptidase [Lewinella cohaerens]